MISPTGIPDHGETSEARAGIIALQPIRPEAMFRPDPRDPHVAAPEVGHQFAGIPLRRPVGGCSPRGLQDARFCLRGISKGACP